MFLERTGEPDNKSIKPDMTTQTHPCSLISATHLIRIRQNDGEQYIALGLASRTSRRCSDSSAFRPTYSLQLGFLIISNYITLELLGGSLRSFLALMCLSIYICHLIFPPFSFPTFMFHFYTVLHYFRHLSFPLFLTCFSIVSCIVACPI
jgi:hypothetical protein